MFFGWLYYQLQMMANKETDMPEISFNYFNSPKGSQDYCNSWIIEKEISGEIKAAILNAYKNQMECKQLIVEFYVYYQNIDTLPP